MNATCELRQIPIGGKFRITKNGVIYEKIQEQGMDNCIAYIQNVVRKPSRKCHTGFKQTSKLQTIKVYPI